MNNLALKVSIFIAVILLSSACEDILDKKPVSSLTFESFWSTEDDFEAGLIASYSLTQTALGDLSNGFFLWGDGRADGVTNRTGVGLAYNPVSPGDLYGVDWSDLYRLVNQVNLVIKNANTTDVLSTAKRDQILGEAHFLRALAYFYLGRIWGNVPLLTEGYDNSSQELYPSNNAPNQREMIFDQVKEDVDIAVQLLGFTTNRGYASKSAALALRADYNLWIGWENNDNDAFQATVDDVDEIMNNGLVTYDLVSDFSSIFGKSISSEDVFVVKFGLLTDLNNAIAETWPTHQIEVSPADQAEMLYVPHGSPSNGGGYGRYNVSEKLADLFDDDDERKDVTFVEEYFDGQPSSGLPVYWGRKYTGGTSFDKPVVSERTDHIRIYRTAGILLMKAEAQVKLGDLNEAADIVNMVRERAYGVNYNESLHAVQGTPTMDEMLDIVLDERFKELAWEGKRWFDLVRTKKALTEMKDRLDINSPPRPVAETEGDLLWPISVSSLVQNPKLIQNERYK